MAEAISSISSVEVFEARMQAGLAIASISREDLLLERHAFEDGFDDDVGLIEAVVGELRRDQRHALIHDGLREAALLHGIGVVLADGRRCRDPALPAWFPSAITGMPALA